MSQNEGFLPYPKGFATAVIHHAQEPEKWNSMAIVTPIFTSSTYQQEGPVDFQKYEYSRYGNPTREVLENSLAKLDVGKYGLAFSSGLGAITAVLGTLNAGDHLICGNGVYVGTNCLFNQVATKFGIEVTMLDCSDLSKFEISIKSNTKLVWIESPSNPTMQVVDIKALSKIAKMNNVIVAMDNTFLTPYLSRPLEFGVDIVCYSLSKYMNAGHSDVVMGALVTSDEALYEKLKFLQCSIGGVPSPFDCCQVIRGLKTLPLRIKQHKKNALEIAKYLESHPKVEKVLHPGLPSHPRHELFKRQTSGHSGIFSFYLKGNLETSKTLLKSVKLFELAASLGGCESLIELPSIRTHTFMTEDQKAALGIKDTLVRVSVGIEDVEDLIGDLEQALNTL